MNAQDASALLERAPLDSFFGLLVSGGPVMVPLGLCSVVAFALAIERVLRLRASRLGDARLSAEVARAARESGATSALGVCRASTSIMGRVLAHGLERVGERAAHDPHVLAELERGIEEAGSREVRGLQSGLRPLVVIASLAPLLGLLGTVWGIIAAFLEIGLNDGLGRPDLLAAGIAQALVTTAAGLVIAIPAQALYYFLRARLDRFALQLESGWSELQGGLRAHREQGA